jgi:hypothetical protein
MNNVRFALIRVVIRKCPIFGDATQYKVIEIYLTCHRNMPSYSFGTKRQLRNVPRRIKPPASVALLL